MGPPGSGKSDLALRMMDRGFMLVADDQVSISDGMATAPSLLAGLLEIRGMGLLRVAHQASARLALVVVLDPAAKTQRLPEPRRHDALGVPMIWLSAFDASAPQRVALALDCVLGHVRMQHGAFVW